MAVAIGFEATLYFPFDIRADENVTEEESEDDNRTTR